MTAIPHGTRAGYWDHLCSCDACRAYAAEYQRKANAARRARGLAADDPRHGTWTAYCNWGCRCADCRAAASRQNAKQAARRKAVSA